MTPIVIAISAILIIAKVGIDKKSLTPPSIILSIALPSDHEMSKIATR
jgi:hypothetical protein